MYFYKNFNFEHNYKNIFNTIRRIFTRNTSWETLCKLRVSSDLKIKELYTPVLTSGLDLMILPNLDSDQCFSFTVENKSLPNNNPDNYYSNKDQLDFSYLQIGLLYTHYDGSRRIRIFNYCINRCDTLDDYYSNLDLSSVCCLFAKMIINNLYLLKKMEEAHKKFQVDYFDNSMLNIQEYYKNNKTKFAYLRKYPLYILGMVKNKFLCLDEIKFETDSDLTNYLRLKFLKLSCDEAIIYLNPRLHNLKLILPTYYQTNKELLTFDKAGLLYLPAMSSLTVENINRNAIYLFDNGYQFLIFFTFHGIDKDNLLKLLIGNDITNLNDLSEEKVLYNEYNNEEEKIFKEKIINLIEHLRSLRSNYQDTIFIFEGGNRDKL